jgi:tryptophan-rich sensory protein
MDNARWRSLGVLVICVGLSLTAGAIGSQFMPGPWYEQLRKPAWTPPGWVFAPVWTLLYLMMGTAAWLVWRSEGLSRARPALIVFVVQLLVNAAWSWMFFGLERPGLAMIDLLVLWVLIIVMMLLFWRHHFVAGLLILPYVLWVTYAATLNGGIVLLNRG